METIPDFVVWLRQLWVVWLLLLFLAVIFITFRPKNKKHFEQASKIPLEDNNEEK
jgi:cytochrome c oxidase cbb3-type subunit 4